MILTIMAKQKSQTDETQKNKKSQAAFTAALRVLAGGVNSPVRAFGAIGGVPRFIAKAKGATLTDLDGNDYIDYVGSWGPLILGHTDERVAASSNHALLQGLKKPDRD